MGVGGHLLWRETVMKARTKKIFLSALICFSVRGLLCPQEELIPAEFLALFEKVELEELPPAEEYYVDDSPLHQILKMFDEEDYKRQKDFLEQKQKKIIRDAGGILLPQEKYAQGMIHDFIARCLTVHGKENLYKVLDDGELYRLYVREEIKKRKLPPALEYLPVVESEYKASAKSKSGAKGLWQFMENSMSPFLKKSNWFDERLDPWKSTDAALSKLQDNYRMFGDWCLAIGAYNCGAGAMSRALKKAPVKSFWYLAEHKLIPEETILYVPKLLAITEIAGNPEEYKISLPIPNEKIRYLDFDYLTTQSQFSLDWISSELRIHSDTLRKLNPALFQGMTPPDSKYQLRIPSGMKQAATEVLGMFGENQ